MQRKRRKYNTGRYKYYLYGIPKLFKVKNIESNVLYSIPSVVVLVFLFGLFSIVNMYWYGGNNGLAYAAEEDVSITQPETLGNSTASMTLDTSDVMVDVAPGSIGYASKNIVLNTNNVESYTLSITGPEVLSLENNTSDLNSTNTTTAWGYAYLQNSTITNDEELASLDYNSFTGVNQKLESGTSADSNTRTLAFRASFSDDAIAGHYKAEITLSLAATPKLITYTLILDPNGGNGSTITKTCETYSDCSISLNGITAPTKANHTFLGWAETSDWANTHNSLNPTYNTTGISSNPAESTINSVTMSSSTTTNNTKTIYAVYRWGKPGFSTITNMQQMTSSICSNATIGDYKELIDTRESDNTKNRYIIQKFNDGRCWMTQNLRIMGSKTLTASDSNVSSNYSLPASSTSGFSDNAASNAYLSADANGAATGYYTWCAATAGSCSGIVTRGDNAPYSICPSGWKLPTGYQNNANNNDFRNFFLGMNLTISNNSLASAHSGSNLWGAGDLEGVQGSPYDFAFVGNVNRDNYNGPSTLNEGVWWSSTASGNGDGGAYALYFGIGGIYPGTDFMARYYGFAVRCINQ